jgi:hypothetical protein
VRGVGETLAGRVTFGGREELERASVERGFELCQEKAAEEPGLHAAGQKETRSTGNRAIE